MVTNDLKKRLEKVYNLVKRGSAGEKEAADKILNRILEKYSLEGLDLESLAKEEYFFKYSTDMENWLLVRLTRRLCADKTAMDNAYKQTRGIRQIRMLLTAMDWATLSSAYEYYRRHMKGQWELTALPALSRCRKPKTKAVRRKELQKLFYEQYIIASGLVDKEQLITVPIKAKQRKGMQLIEGLEGGRYATQVNSGLMLGGGDV